MKTCFSLLSLLLAIGTVAAAERPRPDPAVLAAEIDRLVADRLKSHGLSAAPAAEDAAWFRRVNLVLAGRIAASSEVRAFLADPGTDKRARAIERLLASAAYANHLTTSWRNWLLPEALTNPDIANAVPAFEVWLRTRIRTGMPLDQLTRELLTHPLNGRTAMATDPETADGDTGPLAFYLAKEGKPENLAAATSRIFLGVHLECAQCHNHPFARWTREQFWGMAAFFAGVERPMGGGLREMTGRRELLIPNSDRAVPITFLDDRAPEWQYKKSPRVTLAAWVTAPENPFFARAMANRLWWLVFGVGLVVPVDDLHDQNPPSHPELLDTLARALVDSGFDTRFLLRAICLSQTFGRASSVSDPQRQETRLFAHFPIQGLAPEQLYQSLAVVLGTPPQQIEANRQQFLETFAAASNPTDAPTTILQALSLMNGSLVGSATESKSGRLVGSVLQLPGLTPAERVEALYLATLGRPPAPRELQRALKYLDTNDAAARDARHADILWALLNGLEFRTNH